jgi:hypothetical protein
MPGPVINEILWSDWSEDHVEAHGILVDWVEATIFERRYVVFKNAANHPPERIRLIGRAAENCPIIAIILAPTDAPDVWWVVTAFNDLSHYDKEKYRNAQQSSHAG